MTSIHSKIKSGEELRPKEISFGYTDVQINQMDAFCENMNAMLLNEVVEDDRDGTEMASIDIELSIEKKNHGDLGPIFFLTGDFDVTYEFSCVKCLVKSKATESWPIEIVLIDEMHEERTEYADQISAYFNGIEWNLFFYQQKALTLKDTLELFFNDQKESYPLHSEDCKGLCGTCGIDLNKDSCSHNNES